MVTESMRLVWERAKEAIRSQVPDQGYSLWIDPLRVLRSNENSVVLGCPNSFSRKWLEDHYGELLKNIIRKTARKPVNVVIEVSTGAEAEDPENCMAPIAPPKQLSLPTLDIRPCSGRLLKRDFTFDRFVVGDCNDFAYSAALSMASRPQNFNSSLFLLSKTGLGKSHLSQAVGRHIMKENPAERVFYITAEDFTNEMVNAIHNGRISQFKEKFRQKCDTLILEDVQFFSGKNRTQEELAFTLDTLMESQKRLVFTSSYLPGDIPKLNDSVRSRLSSSVITNMEPPDFRMRVRILQRKARLQNAAVPTDVIEYLASELTGDVRQLESGLNGVAAKSSLLGRDINMEMAVEVVRNIARNKRALTLGVIKRLVGKYYRVTDEELRSKSRKQAIVRPRQVAMYLGRRYTDQSLQAIGRSFNRYHATALHAVGVVERHMRENGVLKDPVEFLCKKIEDGEF